MKLNALAPGDRKVTERRVKGEDNVDAESQSAERRENFIAERCTRV